MRCRCRLALVASLAVVSVTVFAGCGKKPAAVVNGKRIERARYEELLERTAGAPLLVQLISEELILQEAEKQKVMPPPQRWTAGSPKRRKPIRALSREAPRMRRAARC